MPDGAGARSPGGRQGGASADEAAVRAEVENRWRPARFRAMPCPERVVFIDALIAPASARSTSVRCAKFPGRAPAVDARTGMSAILVIEAIAEKMEWKRDLYAKVAPFIPRRCDLRLQHLRAVDQHAQGMPEALRPQFCGIHFFNPPRYMALVELIPPSTDAAHSTILEAPG